MANLGAASVRVRARSTTIRNRPSSFETISSTTPRRAPRFPSIGPNRGGGISTLANPWTPFYWADYIADTGHLALDEHGVYLLLMAHYYRTRRPLPANAPVLHRICRCTSDAEKAAVDKVLGEFFSLDGDLYRHHRIEDELSKATDISEKRRAAANTKHQKDRHANALQMHSQSQSQSNPSAQSKSDSPSLETQSFHSKEKPSQKDFEARDRRKLAEAFRRIELQIEASVGSGCRLTEKEIFELACRDAGISVERGLEVEESGRKWPQSLGASA